MKQIEYKKQLKEMEKEETAKYYKTNFGPEESPEVHSLLADLERQKKEKNKEELQETIKNKQRVRENIEKLEKDIDKVMMLDSIQK